MASQDTISNGKSSEEHNSLKQKECTNERPIITQRPNKRASPVRPPVAAKPRRKPPAPSPKPGKPPAPPIPSLKPSPSSSSSSISSSNLVSSPSSSQLKDDQNSEKSQAQNGDESIAQVDKIKNLRRENSYDPSINPFEGETDEILPSVNSFEKEDETSPPGNPFEEEEENSPPSNPFEEGPENLPSTNPFEEDSEILSDQNQTKSTTASQKSSQPPPLPTSPPSKARLSRSLSGIKVNSSQNKKDSVLPDVKTQSSCSSQTTVASSTLSTTQPSLSSSNLSQTLLTSSKPQSPSSSSSLSKTAAASSSSSSSLNVISSTKPAQLPLGKSPPPLRPKPPTSAKPSPVSSSSKSLAKKYIDKGNNSPSPNPPPRNAKETKNQSAVSTFPSSSQPNTEAEKIGLLEKINSILSASLSLETPPENDGSLKQEENSASTCLSPPPVPKKSPKPVPKPSTALPDKSHRSPPPPRPLSPPNKSQSPPPAGTPNTKITSDDNVSIPQLPNSVEKEDDLKNTAALTPSSSHPLNHDLTQPFIPPNPDQSESSDIVAKFPGGKDENQNVSGTAGTTENKPDKEPDKKRVPPPLPKNPPRGRPLRRSVSGPATQPDVPPPPPPPPRVPALASSSRSLSLQEESVTEKENKSKIVKIPLDHAETKDCANSNSNQHPVAPLRKSKESSICDTEKKESEESASLTKSVESVDSELVSSSSVNSFSEDNTKKERENRVDVPVENKDKFKSNDNSVKTGHPRPVPRKRLSRNSVEISKDFQEQKTSVIIPKSDCQPEKNNSIVVFEHEYSEVYRGDSPEKTSNLEDSSTGSHQQFSRLDDDTEDISHSSNSDKYSEQDLGDSLSSSNNVPIRSNGSSSKTNTDSCLSNDEPEATCDMLKEIEELLKNKLGVSDESTLISLSNEDINLRISGKDDHDADVKDQLEEEREEPIRPPRPKRDASLNRDNSESLTDLNSPKSERRPSSASDLGSTDTSKKFAPAKPKRTTLPRVKRSLSDVTGTKSVFEGFHDNCDTTSSEVHKSTDDIKPELPPRNESLKKGSLYQSRQQAILSADTTTPPPLPPRNKPRSASMNVSSSNSDDPPPKPFLSAVTSPKNAVENKAQAASPGRGDMSAFTKGALPMSATSQGGVNRSPAPRPARKAPPPPPHAKRNATFGPGDQRSSVNICVARNPEHDSKSAPQASTRTSPSKSTTPNTTHKTTSSASAQRVKKSRSLFHKFTSKKSQDAEVPKKLPQQDAEVPKNLPEQDAEVSKNLPGQDVEYHEIADHLKKSEQESPLTKVDERTKVKKSPPPRLPPRPKICSPTSSTTSHKDGDADERHYASAEEDVESSVTSSEGDQGAREKRAQSSLIQKVSQDIASSFTHSDADTKTLESKDNDEVEVKVHDKSDEQNIPEDDRDTSDDCKTIEPKEVELIQNETDGQHEEPGVNYRKDQTVVDLMDQDRRLSSVSAYSITSDQDDEEGGPAIEDISSHSDTDPEDAEAIYAERKAKKVFNIAQEIASSERTFVDVLKLLNLDFRLHISKETEKHSQPIIPAETLNKILDFLPQLQNFNEDLLKDIEHRIECWEDNPCLSDIFVKKGPFLKLYSSYIRNFENSTAILDDACKKNQLFAAAVKDFEMSPKCGKLALKHFMLKPIQRIPQYKLLLQEYLKNLHPHSQDYKNTTIALNIVTEVADHANESMRHGDNVQKLLEIQRSLIGQFEVIQPGREFIKQGELQKVSRKVMQPRMFFLFSDVLLYTTPVTSGFKLNNILPLSGMKINNPKLEVYKYEFNIIGVQRSFTLCASSSHEKKEWLKALHGALDENMKRFNTFESHKGPQTSLIDKDFVLGAKAPLWVPDARVTMCMLCLSEFTITWRRHHCRSCGRITCHQCSNNKAPLRYLQYKPARVCNQCYDKLHSDMLKESQQQQHQNSDSKLWRKSSFRGAEDRSNPTSPTATTSTSGSNSNKPDEGDKEDSSLSFSRLLNRFHRIRKSGDKRNFRPSVLKEVRANDEGSDMSGYLRIFKNRKWKKLWFVVKGKVLYTYKASEDMAAIESKPLLGYEVTRMNVWYEGAEPDLLFELSHQNTQPLVSKTSGDAMISPKIVPDLEKTKQRLIFRTDSATAVTKWLDVLRAASCT